jgi:undecaprenyl-diphosphatase
VAVKGRPALGRRMAIAAVASWGGSKIIKRFVGRGRPDATVNVSRLLGREATGLGYPSGHAAVAASLAVVVQPELDRSWRALAWAVALVVGPTRSYVGVHLPLDIAGGIFLGVAVGTVSRALVP